MARARKASENADTGLQSCLTEAGQPAWRWGPQGYAYGYDPEGHGTPEDVAKQQALDWGQSMDEVSDEEGSTDGEEGIAGESPSSDAGVSAGFSDVQQRPESHEPGSGGGDCPVGL
jgi:hypothetical protein